MPRDRLALAVLVRREQELVRIGEVLLELRDDLLLARVDDVVRLEVLLHVDTERAEALALALGNVGRSVRQVTNVAHARVDREVAPEVAGDRPRFRGRLDDDEGLAHRRNTLAPLSPVTGARYCVAWPLRPARAGCISSSAR